LASLVNGGGARKKLLTEHARRRYPIQCRIRGEYDDASAHGPINRQAGRPLPLSDVSLLDRIHVGVEHLLHFMLAHSANLLLDDAAAFEQ